MDALRLKRVDELVKQAEFTECAESVLERGGEGGGSVEAEALGRVEAGDCVTEAAGSAAGEVASCYHFKSK